MSTSKLVQRLMVKMILTRFLLSKNMSHIDCVTVLRVFARLHRIKFFERIAYLIIIIIDVGFSSLTDLLQSLPPVVQLRPCVCDAW